MVSANPATIEKVDYINFQQDRACMNLLGEDEFHYGTLVKKINMFEWKQERTMVITNQAIYNIHKKKIKRCIMLKDIGGMTKTVTPSKNLKEFTIHAPQEYDYRFLSDKREEIMNVIKKAYYNLNKRNCPVYHTTNKDLKDFTTTENDAKKGVSRFPPEDYRMANEDLFQGD